ncbi:hypothetical protein [Homoserinimonas hongtaonis]|uniref:Uncharacterized protein n=1 Tax=Homoserinimonas hongtaonis TaxID=2079791 RepID=A0A2U1T1V8_9MICO|nr:hypothetical protein [Salinibacterium hongtaonis]AWB90423.1 hypothetical protein C2138_13435 [Salinibacterium hongtaonis]PWB97864.1 hypothetical protein DF220_08485 [Salinibacterium hongtaonis]
MTQPTRKDVMRPYEYLGIAAAIGVFCGLIILATTRDVLVTIIGFGVIFILALLTLALLAIAMKPGEAEQEELDERSGGVLRKNDGSADAH